MAYGIIDLSKNLLGIKSDTSTLRKDEFWAVDDVSFDLRRGEVLGLIGTNGSGKTTLLRVLTGIFPTDKGEMSVRGRVGALIAIGAGFHPHMTGRENIYLNGTVLGMSGDEIDSKFNEIVNFAEMWEFLDAPVSTYSSGMRVRLGFSIATHVEPEVMMIDEVLSVGDALFQYRCIEKIRSLKNSGTSMIFVSHNMDSIALICDAALLLMNGKLSTKMPVTDAIDIYNKLARENSKVESFPIKINQGKINTISFGQKLRSGKKVRLEISSYRILDSNGRPCKGFLIGEYIVIEVVILALMDTQEIGVALRIRDTTGTNLVGRTTHHNNISVELKAGQKAKFQFSLENLFKPDAYSISIAGIWLAIPGNFSSAIAEDQLDNVYIFESIITPGYHVYSRIYLPIKCEMNII